MADTRENAQILNILENDLYGVSPQEQLRQAIRQESFTLVDMFADNFPKLFNGEVQMAALETGNEKIIGRVASQLIKNANKGHEWGTPQMS